MRVGLEKRTLTERLFVDACGSSEDVLIDFGPLWLVVLDGSFILHLHNIMSITLKYRLV